MIPDQSLCTLSTRSLLIHTASSPASLDLQREHSEGFTFRNLLSSTWFSSRYSTETHSNHQPPTTNLQLLTALYPLMLKSPSSSSFRSTHHSEKFSNSSEPSFASKRRSLLKTLNLLLRYSRSRSKHCRSTHSISDSMLMVASADLIDFMARQAKAIELRVLSCFKHQQTCVLSDLPCITGHWSRNRVLS